MPNVHVKVPQKDGEISVAIAGDEPKTYRVTDGQVSVAPDEVDHFLAIIDGAQIVGGSPSEKEK